MLIFNICRRGLLPSLIKKSWTESNTYLLTYRKKRAQTKKCNYCLFKRFLDSSIKSLTVSSKHNRIKIDRGSHNFAVFYLSCKNKKTKDFKNLISNVLQMIFTLGTLNYYHSKHIRTMYIAHTISLGVIQ